MIVAHACPVGLLALRYNGNKSKVLRNFIQIAIFVAAIGVLYLPVREYFLSSAVTADLEQLDYLLADFEVVDPKKVYIRALELDRHLHYAWRVYLPEDTAYRIVTMSYGGTGMGATRGIPARSFVMRLRIEITSSEYRYFYSFDGGGGGGGRGRWSIRQDSDEIWQLGDSKRVQVRQFGKGQTVEVNVDQPIEMLSLHTLSDNLPSDKSKPVFLCRIVPAAMNIMTGEKLKLPAGERGMIWEHHVSGSSLIVNTTTNKSKPTRLPGISLWFAMVLFSAIIVWLGLRAERKVKESKVAELKAMIGESVVKDFDAFGVKSISDLPGSLGSAPSAIKHDRLCEVYLPRGGSYEICFAGSGIGPAGFPKPDERFAIESGYRKIRLSAEKENADWKFSLLVNENVILSRTFDGGIGVATLFAGYSYHGETKQQSTDQRLELIRNMLGPSTATTSTGKSLGVGDGILIWIEKK